MDLITLSGQANEGTVWFSRSLGSCWDWIFLAKESSDPHVATFQWTQEALQQQ